MAETQHEKAKKKIKAKILEQFDELFDETVRTMHDARADSSVLRIDTEIRSSGHIRVWTESQPKHAKQKTKRHLFTGEIEDGQLSLLKDGDTTEPD